MKLLENGETMKTVIDFIFLGSKITADGECSHEIKRCVFLGRKTVTNLDSILKSRDRVPTFTATIQHSSGSFGHSNQSRKRNKRNL